MKKQAKLDNPPPEMAKRDRFVRQRSLPATLILAGIGLWGAWLLWATVTDYRLARESATWPTVSAVIVDTPSQGLSRLMAQNRQAHLYYFEGHLYQKPATGFVERFINPVLPEFATSPETAMKPGDSLRLRIMPSAPHKFKPATDQSLIMLIAQLIWGFGVGGGLFFVGVGGALRGLLAMISGLFVLAG